MRKPFHTLLDHFRHESTNYYWDLHVKDTRWIGYARSVIGDERMDYSQSPDHYYRAVPLQDWKNCYISGYASTQPWEDWAETWAYYFHTVDTLESVRELGLSLDPETDRNFATPAQP